MLIIELMTVNQDIPYMNYIVLITSEIWCFNIWFEINLLIPLQLILYNSSSFFFTPFVNGLGLQNNSES